MLARAEGHADAAGELRYAQAVGRALDDQAANAAFKALLLALPSEQDLAMEMRPADPAAIHGARKALRGVLAGELAERLARLHETLADRGPFSADAEAAGRRALRNAALDLLTAGPAEAVLDRARAHYGAADNMTDAIGGLSALVASAARRRKRRWPPSTPAGSMNPWSSTNGSPPRPATAAKARWIASSP